MSIWHGTIDLELVTTRSKNTLADFIGIEFLEIGTDYMKARMEVCQRVHQPLGIMHGGASCVLAETLGSTAANCCVDRDKFYCVGLEINTNHIRPIRSGYVYALSKPYHLGKTTQVWSIEITNEQQKLISINRLTMAVVKKTNQ